MTDQHPLTPPPELVRQWINEPLFMTEEQLDKRINIVSMNEVKFFGIIGRASQHGADQELEACCEWLDDASLHLVCSYLRAARRPEAPKSLKEQALSEIAAAAVEGRVAPELAATILRALEALDD